MSYGSEHMKRRVLFPLLIIPLFAPFSVAAQQIPHSTQAASASTSQRSNWTEADLPGGDAIPSVPQQSAAPPAQATTNPPDLAGQQIVQRVSPSVVLILTGTGEGNASGLSSGVILRADGVVFTAYHAIKNAKQVQVRLANGETYDQVELAGFDERRDVAALRIPATNLPALTAANSSDAKPGDPVYVIGNPKGLGSSVSAGVLSAVRPADEVPGAGSGYRLLQFTAPVSPGSSGGVVVDTKARALGIVVGTLAGGQSLNFAVPLDSVLGISDRRGRTQFGAGTSLRTPLPPHARPSESTPAELPAGGTSEIARAARTIYIHSRNPLIPAQPVQKNLLDSPDFQAWGFVILDAPKDADLVIELDRPALTWDFTFQITDVKTKAVLGSGKVIAWDGVRAAPSLADEIVKRIKVLRPVSPQQNPAGAQKP